MTELPLEVRNKILTILHKNQKWIYYEQRLKEYKKKRNLSGIQKMQGILDNLERETLANYIESIKQEAITLHDLMQDMKDEDVEYLQLRLHGILFMCDILDMFILDVESIVNKYFSDAKIDAYDNIRTLGAEVKTQIETALQTSNTKSKEVYCKYSDKIYNASLPFIRSYIRSQNYFKAKEERSQQRHEK